MSLDEEVDRRIDAKLAPLVARVAKLERPAQPQPAPSSPLIPARFAGVDLRWAVTGKNDTLAGSGWTLFNGPAKQNGEAAYFRPENITNRDGLLRFEAKREGSTYSAAMMENTSFRVGKGKPWFVTCRMRWEPYWGCWVGWWLYNLSSQREIDGMESVNMVGPTFNAHVTQNGPQTGTKSTRLAADFDVTKLHEYGVGCDGAGLWTYVDGVETQQAGSWWATQFLNADMWPKFQHSLGGWWPRDDAQRNNVNVDTALAQVQFPRAVELAHFVGYEAP